MSLSALISQCPNIQAPITEMWTDKLYPVQPSTYLEFLQSPANTRAIKATITPGGGKRRTAEVRFQSRLNVEGVEGVSSNICTAENVYGDKTETYTISDTDNITTGGEVITLSDWDENCTDNTQVVLNALRRHLERLDRLIAQKSAEEIALLYGNYRTGVGPVDGNNNLEIYTTLKDGHANPRWMQQIKTAARKTGYGSGPVIFADSIFSEFELSSLAGCCVDSGFDIAEAITRFGISVAYDDFIPAAMGGENFALMTEFGAIQLLNYVSAPRKTEDIGRLVGVGANYVKTVVATPSGVLVDLTIKDDCGSIHIIPVATTKTIVLPEDLFDVGDPYRGVNYANGIVQVLPPCDIPCYE